ncbi:hypothetical protein [Mycolicibacterium sp.]|uniref:hypothetical protein n=1 Tax=Mycolicibacterium sp. TaxID=2320850 RepID=UPI00355E99E6
MEIPLRAVLAAGVTAATATAIVAAPAVVLNPPELEPVVVSAEIDQLNAASDLITSVYGVTREWANYASLELAPWALGWVPFGYLVSDQIFIWYPGGGWSPGFVLPVTDSFVYDFLNPVVNDPLNLGTWSSGVGAVTNAAVNGVVGSIGNEIRYALSLDWLPIPLPPLPFLASTQQAGLSAALQQSLDELVQTARGAAGDFAQDLQRHADQIAALVREHSDRIVSAGLQFAADLGSAVPRLPERTVKFTAPAPLDSKPAAAPALVDVTPPKKDREEPTVEKQPAVVAETPDPTTAPASGQQPEPTVPTEIEEQVPEPEVLDEAALISPKKALAEAREARRDAAKKIAADVREKTKSLRDGLRKAATSLIDKRGEKPTKKTEDAGSDKARDSGGEKAGNSGGDTASE